MMLTDFKGSQCSDDEEKDGLRNTGLLAIQPLDVAASEQIFYSTQLIYKISFHCTNANKNINNVNNVNTNFTPHYKICQSKHAVFVMRGNFPDVFWWPPPKYIRI